jgi:hypothetical protein
MQRRKFLIGAGSLAAAGAAGLGTGAFTSTAAGRQVSVSVAGDKAAHLGLVPGGSSHAYTDNGELKLDFDGSQATGDGLNRNSFVKFNELFEIRNNSSDTIAVWLDDDGDPYVNNGATADFFSQIPLDPWQVFWSFAQQSQPQYYYNSEVGYKKWNDPNQEAPVDGRTQDTLGNDLETGIDDDDVLAPVNIDTNSSSSIFNRTGQHPAVLTSGDSIKINLQFNIDDIDPSTITDASGTVVLNAFTHDFAVDVQS